ncbi:MAG: mechanosensitive ion channel [Candidatus Woesearchaeota archaeon]|jgi:small-conductance mechanosensitive channel|nr:mechanosensitive ion channel [Candidatus Woesearchaeota archaeon]
MKRFFVKLRNYLFLKKIKISDERKKLLYRKVFIVVFFVLFRSFFIPLVIDSIFLVIFDLMLFYFTISLVSDIIRIIITSSYRKRNKFNSNHYDNFIIGINHLFFIIHHFSFFIVFLFYFNVDIIKFLTISGLFFAGIAWVFKDHFVNIINGLIIMFSKNFNIGDYISFDDTKGIIQNITFIFTEIKTDEGDITYIPNSVLLSREIINYSKTKVKKITYNFDLEKKIFKKIKHFEKFISNKILREFEGRVLTEDVFIRYVTLKVDRINLNIEVSVKTYNFAIEESIKNFLSKEIIIYVAKYG